MSEQGFPMTYPRWMLDRIADHYAFYGPNEASHDELSTYLRGFQAGVREAIDDLVRG